MSTLHGEPVYPGDRVYDIIDGWGKVESVTHDCLWVNIGSRTKRRYTRDGFTGQRCTPTLEWHKPPRVRFLKDTCEAEKQRVFLEDAVRLMNSISNGSCDCRDAEVVDMCDPEPECDCEACRGGHGCCA